MILRLSLITLSTLIAIACSPKAQTANRGGLGGSDEDKDQKSIRIGDDPTGAPKTGNSDDDEESVKKPRTGTLVEGEWHLTFRHLEGDLPMAEENMNFGLAKALNSVSNSANVVQLEPLEGGLAYSVDPADFGITDGLRAVIDNSEFLRTVEIDGKEWIEADSFMYTILNPRVYYRLTGFSGPAQRGNIERTTERLYMSEARSKENRHLICVEDSDVANGNRRMMERVGSSNKAFWGTADYLLPNGIARAINQGVYEVNRPVTTLRAGEFMYERENGFIGFSLSGFGAQARYEANINVASDRSRDDGFVQVGYGCMNCHGEGYNLGNYIPCGGEGDSAQYPDQSAAAELIRKDNQRYINAMLKLGYDEDVVRGDEPVTQIVKAFERRTGARFRPGDATGAIAGP